MTMMAAIQVGSVFIEFSRFLPSGSQARWRVERIVALPNLPEHVAIRKLEPGGEERLITRSEEHTSELQSLMRSSYAVFCLTTKNPQTMPPSNTSHAHAAKAP